MATRMGKVLRGVSGIIKRIALGGGDIIPLNLSANKNAPEGGKGKFDYVRLVTSIIMLVLVLGYLFGKVTMEQLQNLLELIK